MTTKTYFLTQTDITEERLTVLLNSIPCFATVDWEELEEVPMGERFEFTIQCRNEDLRTVEKMLSDLV